MTKTNRTELQFGTKGREERKILSIDWPLDEIIITQEFGENADFSRSLNQNGHNGIDLAAPTGTPVYSPDDGTVVTAGYGADDSWMGSSAGLCVRIQHEWGFSGHAHLSRPAVAAGQRVNRGSHIGYTGATGLVTGPHLHFETFPRNSGWNNGFAGRVNPRGCSPVHRSSQRNTNSTTEQTQRLTLEKEEKMIRIQAPGRGTALMGAEYVRQLTTT